VAASRVNVAAKIAIDRPVGGSAFVNAAGQLPKKANVNVDVQISVKEDGSGSAEGDEDTGMSASRESVWIRVAYRV
jgi:hypothetical protein